MSALCDVLSTRVGRRRKLGEVSCTECIFQENDSKLMPTVEMELEIPYRITSVVNFRRSVIIVELWRPDVAKHENLKNCVFLEKRPLALKFSKLGFESFHRDTDQRVLFKFRKIWPTGNRRSRAFLPDKRKTEFRLVPQLSLRRGSRLKSARASPRQCTQSAPDFIEIGSFSAEL